MKPEVVCTTLDFVRAVIGMKPEESKEIVLQEPMTQQFLWNLMPAFVDDPYRRWYVMAGADDAPIRINCMSRSE